MVSDRDILLMIVSVVSILWLMFMFAIGVCIGKEMQNWRPARRDREASSARASDIGEGAGEARQGD